MRDTHYTPTIDEFYVGFECEIETSWGYSVGTYPDVLREDTLTGFQLQNQSESEVLKSMLCGLRVKFLDISDVVAMGFIHLSGKSLKGCTERFILEDYNERIHEDVDTRYHHLYIRYYPDRHILLLEAKVDGERETFFHGVIRNKSELKKMLGMLNIKL